MIIRFKKYLETYLAGRESVGFKMTPYELDVEFIEKLKSFIMKYGEKDEYDGSYSLKCSDLMLGNYKNIVFEINFFTDSTDSYEIEVSNYDFDLITRCECDGTSNQYWIMKYDNFQELYDFILDPDLDTKMEAIKLGIF